MVVVVVEVVKGGLMFEGAVQDLNVFGIEAGPSPLKLIATK